MPRRSEIGFTIPKSSSASKINQLIDAISSAINKGVYKPGDILPSVNKLNKELGVSRDTVFKAFRELKRRGSIESAPAKGYYVLNKSVRIFLFLDSYSPYKDVLYNSFVENLPEDYAVDLAFHHYNIDVFESVLLSSLDRYNFFVVMNFDNEKISGVLKKINKDKLLILDWAKHAGEKLNYVCQDFGEEPYKRMTEAKLYFKKYRCFNFVYPPDSVHPLVTFDYFKKFCIENGLQYKMVQHINRDTIKTGNCYIVFLQKDLAKILKQSKNKLLKIGREIGIVAYNDTPLLEFIEEGITSMSTDFELMGRKAAEFIKTRTPVQEIIPTALILRKSL